METFGITDRTKIYGAEVRPVPGIGFGMFATKNLEVGDIVMIEYPVIEIGHAGSIAELCDRYFSLPPAELRTVDALHCDPTKLEDAIANPQHQDNVYRWVHKKQRAGEFLPETDTHQVAWLLLRLWALFWTNCSATPNNKSGLYPAFSRANHSCRPNVTWPIEMMDGEAKLTMTATREIRAGQEIFVTYCSSMRTLPLKERRSKLMNWGFTCRCELCTSEEEKLAHGGRSLRPRR
ncbi:uncharacterized protein GGS25DRAFT_491580 [Hypoxylon fragiforme]|uniref:uncharacterized protein n=1 Tax=Hypoxylon fragiforme TaxID=63214 RepID=UPI0020C6033D|nr:uncharacterized protein GGS25DRAFT_491580 [Hypoxylon fragiforme]KAI2608793.1 hypothetical protein GGS25DRAFT_491580 [Hypoxylon fragiforme]